jgi:hypothetical protein
MSAINVLTVFAQERGWSVDYYSLPTIVYTRGGDEQIDVVYDNRGSVSMACWWKAGQLREVVLSGRKRRRRVYGWLRT